MKQSKITLTASILALASFTADANDRRSATYTSNPVYNAPTLSRNNTVATSTGTWSPIGLDPMDFTAIVSLAHKSEATYTLRTTQVLGSGTGAGAHDSYIYNIFSPNAVAGDVVTLNIQYKGIGATGPEKGLIWKEDPGFKVSRTDNNDKTDFLATLNRFDVNKKHSVFKTFSAQFTVSSKSNGKAKGKAGEDTSFSSDGVIFTSAEAGPVAWTAVDTPETVPEPSSALLLGIGGGLLTLRRKR